MWNLFAQWVPFILGARKENMLTSHGRATPLMWSTVKKSDLKDRRSEFEDDLLERFREVVPKNVGVTIMADRGFGDQKLYQHLKNLGFGFIIRFRDVITVTNEQGESRPAAEWVPSPLPVRSASLRVISA